MRVLISGASGLVGSELSRQLLQRGDEPIALNRNLGLSADDVSKFDAVVNLAGATTGKLPWTKNYKQVLISSRLDTTRKIVDAINAARVKPKVLVSASASGFYGDTGTRTAKETDAKGTGFLSDLASQWELEALKADTRVVLIRTTMVLSRAKGALGKLLPLLRLFVGGRLGSGRQWWDWITVEDEARAIIHLIDSESCSGAYNLTAPESSTCSEVVNELGRAFRRPTLIPVPAFALRLFFGEGADELLLCNQKLSADKLISSGFKFNHPTLEKACAWVAKNPAA